MKVAPIVARLDDCGFALTGGLLEWAALKTAPGRLPAAYVVPTREDAADNRSDWGVDQRVGWDFDVALVLATPARAQAGVSDQLDQLAAAVRGQLIGWTHPEAGTPTLYRGGRLLSVDGASLAWALSFRTAYHLRTTR